MDKSTSEKVLRDFIIAVKDNDEIVKDLFAKKPDYLWREIAIKNLVGYCKNLVGYTCYDPYKGMEVNLYRKDINNFHITFGNFDIVGEFTMLEHGLTLDLQLWHRDNDICSSISAIKYHAFSAFGLGYFYNIKQKEWQIRNGVDANGDKIFVDATMTQESFYDNLGIQLSDYNFNKLGRYTDYLSDYLKKNDSNYMDLREKS